MWRSYETCCERRGQPTWEAEPGNKLKTSICLLRRGYRVDGAFLSKCGGSDPSPRALRPPDNPAWGARTAAALQTRWRMPLCLGDRRSAMGHEHSIKYMPRPPLCPTCSQIMELARTTPRSGDLPDIFAFECRACRVSYIEDGITALCAPSFSRILTISPLGWFQGDADAR